MIKKVQMILLEPKIKYNNWNENFTRKIYQEIENHKKIKINQIEGEKKMNIISVTNGTLTSCLIFLYLKPPTKEKIIQGIYKNLKKL